MAQPDQPATHESVVPLPAAGNLSGDGPAATPPAGPTTEAVPPAGLAAAGDGPTTEAVPPAGPAPGGSADEDGDEPIAADDPSRVIATDDMSGTIAALTADDLDQSERRRLLGRLAGEIKARGIGDLFRPRAAMRWIADAVSDIAPRLPIRDRETLHRHFPNLTEDQLAERLIRNASRTTAAVGATGGGVAAIEWVATPALLSAPVLLAAETVAVVAIELKLIGELHEVYGAPIQGGGSARAMALVQAWASRRGVNPMLSGGVAAVLGTAARRELRDRLLRRFGRNLTTYGPMLTGAAVASYLNRRSTIAIGNEIRKDLTANRKRQAITQYPTQPE
jgi:hypothetical protein